MHQTFCALPPFALARINGRSGQRAQNIRRHIQSAECTGGQMNKRGARHNPAVSLPDLITQLASAMAKCHSHPYFNIYLHYFLRLDGRAVVSIEPPPSPPLLPA